MRHQPIAHQTTAVIKKISLLGLCWSDKQFKTDSLCWEQNNTSYWAEQADYTGLEFQNLGPVTEKACSPSMVLSLGMTKDRKPDSSVWPFKVTGEIFW